MRPHVAELARSAGIRVACYPNAGLPNEFGGYDDTPEHMAKVLGSFAREGMLNLVGGCCGTRPEHIARDRARPSPMFRAAPSSRRARHMRLSGLEPLTITPETNFVVVGERTNVTGSAAFRRLIKDDKYDEAVAVARQQVEGGANILDVCMDEGMLDGVAAMRRFLNLIAAEPDIARIPVMVDSSKFSVIEAGLECLQGKGVVNSISLKEGEEPFIRQAQIVRRFGAAVVVMAFDETGQATTVDHRLEIAHRAYKILDRAGRLPAEDIIFDPNILTIGTGIEEHDPYAVDFIDGGRADQGRAARHQGLGRRLEPVVLVPDRRRACARRCTRSSSITRSRPASTWRSSTPASSRSTTSIDPVLREHVEDLVLNRRPDATERMLTLAASFSGETVRKEDELAWRKRAARASGSRTRSSTASPTSSIADVAEALAVVSQAARHHRGAADGRHEHRRRAVRRRQDVPAAGREVRARDEEGRRDPRAADGRREAARPASRRPRARW